MRFAYSARTKEGELQAGFVEAADRGGAVSILTGHGLFILTLESTNRRPWYQWVLNFFETVSLRDLMVFTRQLATLLESRVPLNEALKTLAKQTRNERLTDVLYEVTGDIDAGLSLSQAFERHGDVFSPFYVNMIRSAELTGRLDEAAGYLADYIERQSVLAGRIKSAMIYPVITILLFFAVAGFIVAYIMPQIEPLFTEAGMTLPFFTRLLVDTGKFLANAWWAVLIGFGALMLFLIDYIRTDEGRALLDQILIRIPVVNTLVKELVVARFAESVSILTKGGIPIAQALEVSSQTVGNVLYRDILREVADSVRRGELLSQALARHGTYFPPLVSQMIAVGESTGRLDDLLLKISQFYGREVEGVVANLVELIQPVLMVLIGGLVALLFMSIIVPIYNLSQTF